MPTGFNAVQAICYWADRFVEATQTIKSLGLYNDYEKQIKQTGSLLHDMLERKVGFSYSAIVLSVVPLEEHVANEARKARYRKYLM